MAIKDINNHLCHDFLNYLLMVWDSNDYSDIHISNLVNKERWWTKFSEDNRDELEINHIKNIGLPFLNVTTVSYKSERYISDTRTGHM